MTRLLFLLFGLLLSSSSLAAIDDYVVKQWNIQSGLPSQSVKSVVQDEQGYIWLGTQFGLSRFDGHQFQNFNTQNTDFLNSNAINKLLVDRFGMLWIGTRRGLLRLDPQTMVAQRFDLQGPVRDILADEDGGIWVAAHGLYYVSAKKLTLAANNIEQSNLSVTQINQIVGSVTKMALVPDGIWLVNERHLLKISESSNRSGDGVRLELASKVSLPEQLAQTIVHDLAWVDGKLFLASELGAYFLDFDEVLRRYQEVGNNAVYKFLNDKEGGLWVSTYGRLLYRQSNGIWQSVEPIQLDQSIWFADIFMDDDSNIWLASLNEGLWLAHAGKVERHHIGQRSSQAISAITQSPDGDIWVASREGLGIIGPREGYKPVLSSLQLNRSVIHDLEFVDERLIIGTDRGALLYEEGSLQPISDRELRQNPVFSLSPSNRGGMWFGTGRGLYRLDYNGITPFAYNAFLGSQFVTFVQDFPRYGFIGTNKGAYRYNDKGIEKIGAQISLDSAYVTSILHLDTVTTLVGSLNDGLFYRTKTGDWYQLDASNGLPYGSIFSLHFDKNNQLIWVSTMKGVYRMPVKQFSTKIESLKVEQVISPFDRQLDGRPSQCCSGLGHDAVVETDEAIFYPSLQGVVEIPKNVQLFGGGDLQPRFESLVTDERTLSSNALTSEVELDTSERDLTINYTAIDFYAPHSIEFRYRLEGHDSQWRDAQSRREAIYTNLPPGNFRFLLEVKRQGQDWEQAKTLALDILMPRRFDETVYFRLFITCAFVFMFYLIFWVFRAQERRKQAALEDLVAERTTELRKANEKLNQVNTQLKLVSHSDELTGLRSRRFLFDQLPKDVEHYQRNAQSLQAQNKSLVLMIMNIDNFSKINDSYGPIGGDSCLQQLATLLNTRTQGSDYVVRWSGDEFLLLLRDFSRDHIEEYVSDLCKAIAETDYLLPNGKSTKLTVSMGWSYYPLPLLGGKVIGWESSVNLADIALHQVKQRGGDGAATIIFDEQLDAFEFEQSANIEAQLELLQSNGLADVKVWMR
ncbi:MULTISPECIES: two-component regulator propeller domain-containing protein [unclassified Pseudoalteromonas]|uniref:two-component regulator propeller domain-containing protein n=1 Tax=unclassified Pseudoalteromonas TaxID=194690 RepID=UPI0030150D5C